MTREKCTVHLPSYAEARPVAEIVQTASQYESRIFLISGDKKINAKSIMGMMSLTLSNEVEIEVEAEGPDEDDAVNAIVGYMSPVAS
ncbi:MAG: HPr family phosphocarrier protein [Eubacterium sp.]|nr:HPr family phosphocarrier protein [Eubacterium sp.]